MGTSHSQTEADKAEVAGRPNAAPAVATLPAMVLRTQATAGNKAATALARTLPVQRHAPGPTTAPGQPIGEAGVTQIIGQGVAAAVSLGEGHASAEEQHGAASPKIRPDAPSGAPPPPSSTGGVLSRIGGALRRSGSAIASGARAVGGGLVRAGRNVPGAIARAQAIALIKIDIVDNGAPGAARARTYINEIFLSSSLANLQAMRGKTIEFNIIPLGTKLTELAPFTSLAGTKTFDGRLWDDVRGIWMSAGAKTVRFAVGVEDLGTGSLSDYGPGFVAAHEGGHGLHLGHGLTKAQKTAITTAYTARKAAHDVTQTTPATDAAQAFWLQPQWYSAANENEYFASSVAAWFGYSYGKDEESRLRYTKSWLKDNDRPMYKILKPIYG